MTEPSSKKRKLNSPCAVHDFTYSKEEHDKHFKSVDEFITKLKSWAKKYCFQLEKSDNGYIHYQGRVSLIKKRRNQEINKITQDHFPGVRWSITTSEVAKSGDMFYCMKDDTRIEGPWKDTDRDKFMPFQFDITPRPWQQSIIDSAQIRHSRRIDVIIDETGNMGKSTLAGYCHIKFGYRTLNVVNDAERLIATVCDILMSTQERDPKLFFIDIPRSFNSKKLRSIFTAIEIIKNGIVTDTRYTYREWCYNSPRIWVFANSSLGLSHLSQDRWKFHTVENNQLVPVVPVV